MSQLICPAPSEFDAHTISLLVRANVGDLALIYASQNPNPGANLKRSAKDEVAEEQNLSCENVRMKIGRCLEPRKPRFLII